MTLATSPIELGPKDAPAGLDAASFRGFYDEALPRIYGYFLRRTSSPTLAEDLTQDTFMAAVRELKSGRLPQNPAAWIHGIARHKLVDHYRRAGRSELALSAVGEPPLAATTEDAERERVAAALARVPATQRAVVVLCHLDGFTVREVAEALGKSEKAVESLLGRGRESLRRAYLEAAP
jgi:RNA polymerase sigma-70 factor, ECF subfamily